MSDYVYVGKIINTHGIKGELKVLSDFTLKDKVFLENKEIYIGTNKIKEIINTHRIHQNYDLITLKNYTNINEVLKYKGLSVYVKRSSLNVNYVLNDLIGLDIIDDDIKYGKVVDYYNFNGNIVLFIKGRKEFYIPYNKEYIKEVDLAKKEIKCNNVKDLIL